jgi:hypothetical protein
MRRASPSRDGVDQILLSDGGSATRVRALHAAVLARRHDD